MDTHHHFTPPSWLKAMVDAGLGQESGRSTWSVDIALEAMDKSGTETAMISTGQFIWRLGEKGRYALMNRLSRDANEFGTKMGQDPPGRFFLMAQLPLPDIDATLKEIEYAYDTLKVSGIGITTSYATTAGHSFIGDDYFTPILQELNRRNAIVYSHPAPVVIGKHNFPREEETTQNILSVLEDAASKYPNIRWMFSHSGGTMPYIIQRIVGREVATNLDKPAEPGSKLALLRSFYYDTAQGYNRATQFALKAVVTSQQIVFGTDMHGGNVDSNMEPTVRGLENCGVYTRTELDGIYRGNAAKLFPQLNAAKTT